MAERAELHVGPAAPALDGSAVVVLPSPRPASGASTPSVSLGRVGGPLARLRATSRTSAGRRVLAGEAAKHLALLLIALTIALPLWWMAATSFKTRQDVFLPGYWLWPPEFSVEGYARVFARAPFGRWMLNSLFVGVIQTLGTVIVGFLAAFAFARFEFPGRQALFLAFLGSMMIPAQAIMVPSYVIVAWLGWLDTYQGLIVPHLASAFGIFLLRQFFLTVPRELADAAAVDGCGHGGVLRHVYLPLAAPALVALAMITFVASWNDYFWPLLIVNDDSMRTLPLAVARFTDGELSVDWSPTMAAATMASLPALGLYAVAQRRFLEGFAMSGLKG
jgi:ABC-type glycerol-3-phosphate transport system permease component